MPLVLALFAGNDLAFSFSFDCFIPVVMKSNWTTQELSINGFAPVPPRSSTFSCLSFLSHFPGEQTTVWHWIVVDWSQFRPRDVQVWFNRNWRKWCAIAPTENLSDSRNNDRFDCRIHNRNQLKQNWRKRFAEGKRGRIEDFNGSQNDDRFQWRISKLPKVCSFNQNSKSISNHRNIVNWEYQHFPEWLRPQKIAIHSSGHATKTGWRANARGRTDIIGYFHFESMQAISRLFADACAFEKPSIAKFVEERFFKAIENSQKDQTPWPGGHESEADAITPANGWVNSIHFSLLSEARIISITFSTFHVDFKSQCHSLGALHNFPFEGQFSFCLFIFQCSDLAWFLELHCNQNNAHWGNHCGNVLDLTIVKLLSSSLAMINEEQQYDKNNCFEWYQIVSR